LAVGFDDDEKKILSGPIVDESSRAEGASHTRAPSVAAAAAAAAALTTHEYMTDTSTRPLVVSRGPPTPDDNRHHARRGRITRRRRPLRRARVLKQPFESVTQTSAVVAAGLPSSVCLECARAVRPSVRPPVVLSVSPSAAAVRTISPFYRLDTCAGARAIAISDVNVKRL